MLSLEDCIALSDLTRDEIQAIAEHEHLPEMLAAELGCCLVHCPDGRQALEAMLQDGIAAADTRGDSRHAAELQLVLQRFIGHCRSNPALCGP